MRDDTHAEREREARRPPTFLADLCVRALVCFARRAVCCSLSGEKNATALDDIAEVVKRGQLRATLSATVGLDSVPDAFGVSAEGHVVGKIAVDVTKR